MGWQYPVAQDPLRLAETNQAPSEAKFTQLIFWSPTLLTIFTSILLSASSSFFVSPNGNDQANGTLEAPFRTIQRAATLAGPGDTVWVMPGTYRETVRPKFSGDAGLPIVFRTYGKGNVILSGCDPVTGWKSLGNGVYSAPLVKTFTEDFQSEMIFQNGKPLELKRWPFNRRSIANPTDAVVEKAVDAGGDQIELFPNPKWSGPDGLWNGAKVWVNLSHLGTNWGQDGQAQTGTVVSTNKERGSITVSGIDKRSWADGKYNPDQPWGIGPGTEFFLFDPNASRTASLSPAQFLEKGEWWWDQVQKTVFVRLAHGAADGIESRKRSYAFDLSDRHDIVIDGFDLQATTVTTDLECATRTNSVASAHRIALRNLKGQFLTHFTDHSGQFQTQWLQKSGIRLSGTDNVLENCSFRNISGPAVCVIGRRNRVLGNTIVNGNYSVSEAGCIETGRPYEGGVISEDHEIGYNTILDSPQQGINFRAIRNSDAKRPGVARIHHNLIQRVMTRTYDSAAFDQYGTDGNGLRLDHNVVLDMVGSLRIGIYLDFGKGYLIDHNAFWNVDRPIQCNWTDPKVAANIQLLNNTALGVEGPNLLPGIYNGVGETSPGTTVHDNLVSLKVAMGKDVVESRNSIVSGADFVNPGQADFRLRRKRSGGAVPFGEPMFPVGAVGYASLKSSNLGHPKKKPKG